jgi:hypothetical protein
MRLLVVALALLGLAGCGGGWRCAYPDPHITNEGAKVTIEENAELAQGILGLFTYGDHGEHIQIRGALSRNAYTLVHEYEHLIETRLHAAGDFEGERLARQAFRDLNAKGFEIGYADLMGEIPECH